MHNSNDKARKGRRWIAVVLLVVLLMIAITALIGRQFVGIIRARVRSTTVQVVSEQTKNKAAVLDGLLNEAIADVNLLAVDIGTRKKEPISAFVLNTFKADHHTTALAVLDAQGQYLYGSEQALALGGIPEEFAEEVAASSRAMSDAVPDARGRRCILLGAQIPGGGMVCAALSAQALQTAYGESTYRGEGYSYVVEQDGTIVIPPVRYSYEQVYENIEDILSDAENDVQALRAFMAALANGNAGSVVFTFDGQQQLICFEPLEVREDWQLVTVVPVAAVEQDGAEIIRTAFYMACVIVGVIALALICGACFFAVMQRKGRENDRFLRNIYRAISENIDTVIFILDDKSAHLDYVFENSRRLLGISAEEFTDSPSLSNGRSAFCDKLSALLQNQRPDAGYEQELHLYNDRLQKDMWLKVLICPFSLGSSAKHIYAISDITEEYTAREKITAAVAVAEQANAAKSSFLANMSHDMRTPMNGIVGMTAIAKHNLNDSARVLDCLDKIDLSSRHLLNLINNVLDMSKIESGKFALAREPFDLTQLLYGLDVMLRPQYEARRQTLALTLHTKHTQLLGDTVRLNQIFMNLLSNAVKFTPEGGHITVTAKELEQRHADFAAYQFTVSDSGIGMSSEFLNRIFHLFERAGDSEVQKIEGTGLGMAITKNLVSAMGGQISVKSKPGCGSTFLVDLDLPLQKSGQANCLAPEEKVVSAPNYAGRRFLLVEDNAINREIASVLLEEYHAQVDEAVNGQQAVEHFLNSEGCTYDAILMDIQMPVMDGYAATRAIRASNHPQAAAIPIIAMTANAFVEDIRAAKDAGMNAHVAKPIDMDILNQVLEKYLKPRADNQVISN